MAEVDGGEWAVAAAGRVLVRVIVVAGVAAMLSVGARANGVGTHAASQRTQGYLGIGFHDLTDGEAALLHAPGVHGVEVVMVDHDGPAGKAGLQAHDIITRVNGQTVANEDALRRLIRGSSAGSVLALSVLRDGRPVTVSAQLADRGVVERDAMARMGVDEPQIEDDEAPAPVGENFMAPAPKAVKGQSFLGSMLHAGPFTGLEMEVMTPQLAGFFGAPQNEGLLVQTVEANSPAELAGLKAGDVLLEADGVALKTTAAWVKRLRTGKGKPIALTVLRDKQKQQMTLVVDLKKHSMVEWPVLLFGAMQ
ncbi:MAG: PDZ domain-containing protein [Acidobacteriota bacterium]